MQPFDCASVRSERSDSEVEERSRPTASPPVRPERSDSEVEGSVATAKSKEGICIPSFCHSRRLSLTSLIEDLNRESGVVSYPRPLGEGRVRGAPFDSRRVAPYAQGDRIILPFVLSVTE